MSRTRKREETMEEKGFSTWKDFTQNEYRRCNTFQLSIDDLARDLYQENVEDKKDDEEEELNFDY